MAAIAGPRSASAPCARPATWCEPTMRQKDARRSRPPPIAEEVLQLVAASLSAAGCQSGGYHAGSSATDRWRARPAAQTGGAGSSFERSPQQPRKGHVLTGREEYIARSPISSPQVSPAQNRKSSLLQAEAVVAANNASVRTASTAGPSSGVCFGWGMGNRVPPILSALGSHALSTALPSESSERLVALSSLLERTLAADQALYDRLVPSPTDTVHAADFSLASRNRGRGGIESSCWADL